jgi:hypothetical protein
MHGGLAELETVARPERVQERETLRRDHAAAVTRAGDRGATQRQIELPKSASTAAHHELQEGRTLVPRKRPRESDPLVVKTPKHRMRVERETDPGVFKCKGGSPGEKSGLP